MRRRIIKEIGLPCFVKPANLGSSVGISRASDNDSLTKAIDLAAEYDRKIIVEEEIVAREIECAILGNDEPKQVCLASMWSMKKRRGFLTTPRSTPARAMLSSLYRRRCRRRRVKRFNGWRFSAFQSVDGAGLASVDFFLEGKNGRLLINELNTMPGLTEVSGYPKMWEASGKKFSQVLDELIELAFERHREKALTKTSR